MPEVGTEYVRSEKECDLDKYFKIHIKQFIEEVFASDTNDIKCLQGVKLTCGQLFDLCSDTVTIIQNGKYVELLSFYNAQQELNKREKERQEFEKKEKEDNVSFDCFLRTHCFAF